MKPAPTFIDSFVRALSGMVKKDGLLPKKPSESDNSTRPARHEDANGFEEPKLPQHR